MRVFTIGWCWRSAHDLCREAPHRADLAATTRGTGVHTAPLSHPKESARAYVTVAPGSCWRELRRVDVAGVGDVKPAPWQPHDAGASLYSRPTAHKRPPGQGLP